MHAGAGVVASVFVIVVAVVVVVARQVALSIVPTFWVDGMSHTCGGTV